MGMCHRPAVPWRMGGKANWKAWKISHFLHLKAPLRTVAATGRQHPASAPWLWPKFHGEMLKNKVDSFEGVVVGARGEENNFLRRSKHENKWKMISLVFHKSKQEDHVSRFGGKAPALFSCMSPEAAPAASCPRFIRLGSEFWVLSK